LYNNFPPFARFFALRYTEGEATKRGGTIMILQVRQIEKSFGSHDVLKQVDLHVNERDRIGLIGPNGAGKSTLLKIIIGELQADSGEVSVSKKVRIGYLAQHSGLHSERTVWDELLGVFTHLLEMDRKLRHLELEMGKEEVYSHPARYKAVLQAYSQLQEKFDEQGGYAFEARMRGALHGLGLGGIDWKRTPVSALSGGQKTRLALAKILLEEPELLILDEPTNYLDMDAIAWLEQTLLHYPGALLLVSHDRWFLDKLVTAVCELENGHLIRYNGNYSVYVRQKEERLLRLEKAYEEQQEEIRRMEEFILRNIARASTTKRAQSRRKALEKMERIEKPPGEGKRVAIRFEPATASGRQVLEVRGLAIGHSPDQPLIQNLRFRIERGEHIALLGPNGTGKSTLLKTVAGLLPPLSGELIWGTGVEVDYYDQEQKDLNPNHTVLDELWNEHPHLDQTTVRSVLGQFLFSGENVFKRVSDLSGGERARLSLAKRLLNRANFLLMDEPTNHLDMPSKERLEEALEHFPGTLLFVSHDRWFINRLATRIWELTPEGIRDYPGGYEYYLEKKALEKAEEENNKEKKLHTDAESHRRHGKKEHRRKKQLSQKIEAFEQEIAALEEQIGLLQEELCKPEVYQNPHKSAELKKKLTALEELLSAKTDEWAETAAELEEV
jgi:ATP-binding cassette subfamily F protein 3